MLIILNGTTVAIFYKKIIFKRQIHRDVLLADYYWQQKHRDVF